MFQRHHQYTLYPQSMLAVMLEVQVTLGRVKLITISTLLIIQIHLLKTKIILVFLMK